MRSSQRHSYSILPDPLPPKIATLAIGESMERDICGVLLSVTVQIGKPFSDERVADRVLSAMQQQPSPPHKVVPAATRPPMENLDPYSAELDRACLDNVKACEEAQKKSVLP